MQGGGRTQGGVYHAVHRQTTKTQGTGTTALAERSQLSIRKRTEHVGEEGKKGEKKALPLRL